MDTTRTPAPAADLQDFCLSCDRDHQPRDHSVPCSVCREPAWATDARCNLHTAHVTAGMIPGLFQS